MQKTKTEINNNLNHQDKNNNVNDLNNQYSKAVESNKESVFVKKDASERKKFIKQIMIVIITFFVMVGSIVGAAFAIINVKNKANYIATTSLTTFDKPIGCDKNKEIK